MHMKSIEITNYKSFFEPVPIRLEHGFNLFVGANNSGKTTALEALDLVGLSEPHRSIKNLLEYGNRPGGESQIKARISTSVQEMRRLFHHEIYIPTPEHLSIQAASTSLAANQLLDSESLAIEFVFNGVNNRAVTFETVFGRSETLESGVGGANKAFLLNLRGTEPVISFNNYGNTAGNVTGYHNSFQSCIYRFSAQRRPAGECSNSGNPTLEREAGNLPYCINHLQSNDAHGHKLLCEWVNRVFPSVKWIQAPPQPSGPFQLLCLPEHPEKRRDDLAIPLARMGAGIGNVIAMLYVVLTSRHPQVIAIDEPNSFLHPRALRELMQILSSEGKQHQFILTAHSPDVLTAVKPNLITLFEFDGASTSIRQVGAKNILDLRAGLSELGIRMTDLHGRDRVLWVEGQTEEIVFPELLRQFCPEIAAGTAVLRVEHTGTFEKKGVNPSEVAKLYHRLTESSALVPPMVAILLDGESRKDEECTRLENESKGVLRFLDRPMLENYILEPEAIMSVLNSLGESVELSQVEDALIAAGVDKQADLTKVHGANILDQIFSNLSESRHEFKKTRDVPEIISFLIDNRPETLRPLGNFIREVMGLPVRNS